MTNEGCGKLVDMGQGPNAACGSIWGPNPILCELCKAARRIYFEPLAAEFFGRTLQVIEGSRMTNGSYSEPKLAAAWYFWRRGAL